MLCARSRMKAVSPSPSANGCAANIAWRTLRPSAHGCGASPRCTIHTASERNLAANLPAAPHQVLVAGQLFDADGSARMEFVRADADLGAHAEFAAVGKLSRRVVQHDGAVDPREEALGRRGVLRHDALGMLRTILANVGDSAVDAVHHTHRDDGV